MHTDSTIVAHKLDRLAHTDGRHYNTCRRGAQEVHRAQGNDAEARWSVPRRQVMVKKMMSRCFLCLEGICDISADSRFGIHEIIC